MKKKAFPKRNDLETLIDKLTGREKRVKARLRKMSDENVDYLIVRPMRPTRKNSIQETSKVLQVEAEAVVTLPEELAKPYSNSHQSIHESVDF